MSIDKTEMISLWMWISVCQKIIEYINIYLFVHWGTHIEKKICTKEVKKKNEKVIECKRLKINHNTVNCSAFFKEFSVGGQISKRDNLDPNQTFNVISA